LLPMDAGTLNCPMCGAPQSADATQCDHCGARLETVACPSCFGMVFAGAKFCSHCGAKIERTEVASDKKLNCPRCHVAMDAVMVGKVNLHECSKCEGVWVQAAVLQEICADTEEQSAVLGMATHLPPPESGDFERTVAYVPCPECNTLMNRVNFARCSHVVVDVCTRHGTWFDKDELRRIIEFIRAGGLEKSRAQEIQQIQEQRNQLKSAQISGGLGGTIPSISSWSNPSNELTEDIIGAGISIAASVISALLRK
jgi:Zn-finger nucleic acid-binding protein